MRNDVSSGGTSDACRRREPPTLLLLDAEVEVLEVAVVTLVPRPAVDLLCEFVAEALLRVAWTVRPGGGVKMAPAASAVATVFAPSSSSAAAAAAASAVAACEQ